MPFSHLDISRGDLPPWVNQAVAIARPATAAMTAAIPAIGAWSVGFVAIFSRSRALAMSEAATAFLQGIPDAAWGAITAITLGYFGAKTLETRRNTSAGRPAPEDNTIQETNP